MRIFLSYAHEDARLAEDIGAWPQAGAWSTQPIDAKGAVSPRVLQQGLSDLYDPYDWDATLIAADKPAVVAVLARYSRDNHHLQESAVVATNGRRPWRLLLRTGSAVLGVDVNTRNTLIVTKNAGLVQARIARVD